MSGEGVPAEPCRACGGTLEPQARFCGACGSVVAKIDMPARAGGWWRRPRVVVPVAAAVLAAAVGFVVLAAGAGSPDETTVAVTASEGGEVALDGEVVLQIPPGALSADTTLSITRDSAEPTLPAAATVSDVFIVALGGAELVAPAQLRLAYDTARLPEHAESSTIFLARRAGAGQPWQALEGAADEAWAAAEVEYFSQVAVFAWNPSELFERFHDTLEDTLEAAREAFIDLWDDSAAVFRSAWDATEQALQPGVALFIPQTDVPQCDPWPAGFTVPSWADPDYEGLLLGCPQQIGEDGTALVRIANNRAFGVAVSVDAPPGAMIEVRSVTQGTIVEEWLTALSTTLGHERIYLPGAAHAEILVSLDSPGEVTFTAHADDWVPYFETLFFGVKVLTAAATAELGPDAGEELADLSKLTATAECAATLAGQGPEQPSIFDTIDNVADCAEVYIPGLSSLRTAIWLNLPLLQRLVDDLMRGHAYHATLTIAYDEPAKSETGPVDQPEDPTQAAPEPGPSRIAFVSDRGGGFTDILTMDPDGGDVVNVTNDRGTSDSGPSWSPDRGRLVFTSTSAPAQEPELVHMINADGTGRTRVADGPGWPTSPSWSPDGRAIAFMSRSDLEAQRPDIYMMGVDGGGIVNLTADHEGGSRFPDWSPDGSRLAFSSDASSGEDVYVLHVESGDIVNVTQSPGSDDRYPNWSPDGTRIAFRSDRDGSEDIFIMNVDGSNVRNVTASPDSTDWAPTWSPDGQWLAFMSFAPGDILAADVHIIRGDGSDRRNLTNRAGGFDGFPAWN